MRVISLEDHFMDPDISAASGNPNPRAEGGSPLDRNLLDLGEKRIAAMDAAGIDFQVISHTTPGVSALAAHDAVQLARRANERLAAAVREHPDRFAAFAHLPTADPAAAADELERAVTELGFLGAMINGHSHGRFLDDPEFDVLLARAERLDTIVYLHPSPPVAAVREAYYDGFAPPVTWFLSCAAIGWHFETGLHVLRMILAGVFERHPNLRLIVGHMGELLPFMLQRIDDNLPPELTGLEHEVSHYVHTNLHITTSGLFTVPPLLCALMVLGADRVMFSVDWPYAGNDEGRRLLDIAPLSPADMEKLTHANAERLLGLQPVDSGSAAPV
jgi:predicted TIM-barrel fold metal-dependent hydrolase